MKIDDKLEEIKGGNEQVYEKWAQEFESKKKQRLECEKVYGVNEAARKTKQAGAELCQAQHSLSLDLDTN